MDRWLFMKDYAIIMIQGKSVFEREIGGEGKENPRAYKFNKSLIKSNKSIKKKHDDLNYPSG